MGNSQKILLVLEKDYSMNYLPEYPPLALVYIASSLYHSRHEIKALDMRLYNTDKYVKTIETFNPDIIGFSVTALNLDNTKKLMKITKEKNPSAIIIAGGPHASLAPLMVAKGKLIDYLVSGEADFLFNEIADALSNEEDIKKFDGVGSIKDEKLKMNKPAQVNDIDNLPMPELHLFDLEAYKTYNKQNRYPLQTSRGCPHQCTFCTSSRIGGSYRMRSSVKVVDEIEHMVKAYNIKRFNVIDDNFALNRKRAADICDEIVSRNLDIKWEIGQGLTTLSADQELFYKMKKAGCYLISFGVESNDPEILKAIKKPTHDIGIMKRAFTYAKNAGILTKGFMISGLPGATFEKEMKYIDFFKEADIDIPRISLLTVFPNTEMYEWAQKNAKPLHDLDTVSTKFSQNKYVSSDIYLTPSFETDDFTKEERIKAYNILDNEAYKWSIKKLIERKFGKTASRISYPLTNIALILRESRLAMDIGRKILIR